MIICVLDDDMLASYRIVAPWWYCMFARLDYHILIVYRLMLVCRGIGTVMLRGSYMVTSASSLCCSFRFAAARSIMRDDFLVSAVP